MRNIASKNRGFVFLIVSNFALAVVAETTSPLDLTDLTLEELLEVKVEIATGVEQSVSKAPAVTTVITDKDIEEMGATELDDVLETVPGLHVARYHLNYTPIYTIRGIYSGNNSQVLVLINGIPLKELYLGNRGIVWGGMPIKAIARVEIIRGPGSAMFGADAFAGVINIITKTKADIKKPEMGAQFGSFNTKDTWLLYGGTHSGFDTALTLEYHDTNGQDEIIDADAQTHWDTVFGTHVSHAPAPVELSRQRLDARLDIAKGLWQFRSGYQGRRDVGTGGGNAQAIDSQGRFKADRFGTDLTYHNSHVADQWDITAQISYQHSAFSPSEDIVFFPPGGVGGAFPAGYTANPGVSESNSRLDLSAFYSKFKNHLLRLGTGYHYGDLYKVTLISNIDPLTNKTLPSLTDFSDKPVTFLPERIRQDWYLFFQDSWNFAANWELTTGFRYDSYSDFEETLNPRVALVWSLNEKLTTKLLYGQAFRAPAFFELYAVNNPVKLGNSNLDPEKIETLELALNYRVTDRSYAALNLFYYQLDDRIDYVPNPGTPTIRARNLGTQEGKGLEFEWKQQVHSNLNLLGNYAFQESTDKLHGQDAGNAPQHQIYLRSDWLFAENWHLNTQLNWIGERERAFGDPRPPVDDYTWVNLTLRYKMLNKNWGLTLGVHNLLDADAREPSLGPDSKGVINIPNDLPLAGRNYFLSLHYQF